MEDGAVIGGPVVGVTTVGAIAASVADEECVPAAISLDVASKGVGVGAYQRHH